MKTICSIISFFLILVLSASAQLKKNDQKLLTPILDQVDKNQICDRIKFLADDQLRGRAPGTSGYQMAVDFVISELTKTGVEPKGDDGFIQHTRFVRGKIDTTQSELKFIFGGNEKKLRQAKDFTFVPDLNRTLSSVEGQVVFAGYGVTAPHLNYDDYKNLDVRGKIMLVQDGAPQNFPASERAHFGLVLSKCEAANRAGAVGIIIMTADTEKFERLANASRGFMGYQEADGNVFSTNANLYKNIQFLAHIKKSVVNELMGDFNSKELNLNVSAKVTTIQSESTSENVVGIIEGSDPKLKNEYVVHTAHLDHVGVGAPVKGDSIYNGAHDNASGVACVLEMARLYKKTKTKRSILFVFFTSEEKGLLGSGYFASNPTVPKDKIVANVNSDMPTLIAPLLSIEPLGAQHSSLIKQVKAIADFLNLEVMDDHIPDQVRFTRSDQYSFVRQGIPSLHIKYGLKTNDPSLDLKKKIDDWTKVNYHKPSDEFSDSAFDFDAAVTYVKLNFLIGWQVANNKIRPVWNKGDFFGETFGNKNSDDH